MILEVLRRKRREHGKRGGAQTRVTARPGSLDLPVR
jgi:hypothetical protein